MQPVPFASSAQRLLDTLPSTLYKRPSRGSLCYLSYGIAGAQRGPYTTAPTIETFLRPPFCKLFRQIHPSCRYLLVDKLKWKLGVTHLLQWLRFLRTIVNANRNYGAGRRNHEGAHSKIFARSHYTFISRACLSACEMLCGARWKYQFRELASALASHVENSHLGFLSVRRSWPTKIKDRTGATQAARNIKNQEKTSSKVLWGLPP